MAKEKSFVCYANVTTSGIRQIINKTIITSGKDIAIKGSTTILTTSAFVSYLNALVDTNTLYYTTMHSDVISRLNTLITSMIASAVAGQRNRIKVILIKLTEGPNIGHPAFVITKTINGNKVIETLPLNVAINNSTSPTLPLGQLLFNGEALLFSGESLVFN